MVNRTANRLLTDLAIVREALTLLETHSQYAVAKQTGYTQGTIRGWRHRAMREPTGWPTDHDIEQWRQDTEARAEARARNTERVTRIRHYTLIHGHGRRVNGIGTVRRLRALAAIGWSQGDIAGFLHSTQQQVSLLTCGTHPYVYVTTRDTVRELYDRLSMTVPTHRPPHLIARTRADAARKGWAPPLSWDEGQIDNPNAVPMGVDNAA